MPTGPELNLMMIDEYNSFANAVTSEYKVTLLNILPQLSHVCKSHLSKHVNITKAGPIKRFFFLKLATP